MKRRYGPAAHWGWAACIALLSAARPATAELLLPGDLRLRHDIQLLADAGVIDAPITGWPLFLADIEVDAADRQELDPGTMAALARVFPARERHETLRVDVLVSGISATEALRGFNNLPREDGELGARLGWERGRYAADLTVMRVKSPADGKEWRLDGSYAGVAFGNWFLAASAADRWWGPGWDGSLILSNNARPIPALSIQRRRALAPGPRWLRWVGPWTTQVLFGKLESDRDYPDAHFFGWRIGFKPVPRLEIGLSRTAQWCGKGRPCGLDTFGRLLAGFDNTGQNVNPEDEPGNQLAGFDLRFVFPALGRPWAFYTQWIGEDEQNGLPSAHLAQLGLETWGDRGGSGASYRLHAEYSETTCSALTDSDPNYGCAYNHSIYTDGYRYRGRVIGHSADIDGVMFSVGGLLLTGPGHTWQVLLRRGEINRSNSPKHSWAPLKRNVVTLGVSHTRDVGPGELTLGVEQQTGEMDVSGAGVDETRAFARWRRRLGAN